jgi:tripartite ATP-independent transporter DctM subunit
MDLLTVISIYIVVLLLLIFSGMPIAFALGILSVGSLYFGFNPKLLPALGYVTWVTLANSVIGAIPLFIFMGHILFESGLSSRIYSAISPLLDRLFPGGILHSNIVAGAAFAACCGSSIATCATLGAVSLPEMEKRGYDRGIAAGSVAAGGTLGILIPPSIVLIVYGAITDTSIGKLFIGGIIPGVILAIMYMFYIAIRIKLQPDLVDTKSLKQKNSLKYCIISLLKIWPVILLIIGVLGSIYAGFATATEAASIGCALTFVLAAFYRLLNWNVLKKSIVGAVQTGSMILVIFLSASLMGVYLGNAGITMNIANWVASLDISPLAIFLSIFVMYLVLGMLMDSLAAIVITLPITFPIVMNLGFDPIWYGVILTMFGEVGLLTPPVGMNLYILQGLRPNYPFVEIVKGCIPFFIVEMLAIFLMISFPKLITFLPNLIMK